MKPRPQDRDAFELFQSHFDQLLNPKHALVQLAKKIDRSRFETALASCYTEDTRSFNDVPGCQCRSDSRRPTCRVPSSFPRKWESS